MRLGLLGLIPVFLFLPIVLFPAGSAANPIPLLTTTVDLVPQINQGCGTTDIIWTPAANADVLLFRATVTDGDTGAPFPGCELRLEISGWFQSDFVTGMEAHGVVCGPAARTATTDANGTVEFEITGGGCGVAGLHWTLSALCVDPPMILYEGEDTLCVKSYDMDGSGDIDFFDTFKYLPGLVGALGYCCDFAQCSSLHACNFFDTFKYLPHLTALEDCTGEMVQLVDLDAGYDPENDCPLDPW